MLYVLIEGRSTNSNFDDNELTLLRDDGALVADGLDVGASTSTAVSVLLKAPPAALELGRSLSH